MRRPSPAAAGWRRSATRPEHTSMTADVSRPGLPGDDRRGSGIGRAIRGRTLRAGQAGRMRILAIGGRALRVSVRDGSPGWPPLLLCNGIGAGLELLQPFVHELDRRRPVLPFDIPGAGGPPPPGLPYPPGPPPPPRARPLYH